MVQDSNSVILFKIVCIFVTKGHVGSFMHQTFSQDGATVSCTMGRWTRMIVCPIM